MSAVPDAPMQLKKETLESLRAMISEAPDQPGVYVFHGEQGDLPLYIGKSVALRTRLLSHLRASDEVRMLRQTRRISWILTAGEIGALLLEAQMIKQQNPLFNQRLRRNRLLCSLQLQDGIPRPVDSRQFDFAAENRLFGLFASRHAALDKLREIADLERLCHARIGLEKLPAARACFRSSIDRCAGVCRGQESEQEHDHRLRSALERLRLACWPYAGAIGLRERNGRLSQIHVVNNWCYLGSAKTLTAARKLGRIAAAFDADGYRILYRPILEQQVPIVELATQTA